MNDLFHAHRKNIYKGQAAQHVDYVTRQGRHKRRGDLVAAGELNLPASVDSVHRLAEVGDKHERSGGIVGIEWEVAIPRCLNQRQSVALVEDLGTRLAQGKPGTWAIHCPPASDGGDNPHAHYFIVKRKPDEHERPIERAFNRYNAKDPQAGGWKKEREAASKEGFRLKLHSDRLMCEHIVNEHLARHGHANRVDSRSYIERGIAKDAGTHLYPSGIRRLTEAKSPDSGQSSLT